MMKSCKGMHSKQINFGLSLRVSVELSVYVKLHVHMWLSKIWGVVVVRGGKTQCHEVFTPSSEILQMQIMQYCQVLRYCLSSSDFPVRNRNATSNRQQSVIVWHT